MNPEINDFAEKLGLILKDKGLSIVVAESCTGGLLAASITAVSGSSSYFDRGYVTYSNRAKEEDLGVKSETLERFGAVSEEVAYEMALGALKKSKADVGVAITGIAGPTGGSKDKPVGTVCFSLVYLDLFKKTVTMHFEGDRGSVRVQAVVFVLLQLGSMFTLTPD